MKELVLPAEKEFLYSVLDFVSQFAQNHGFKEELFQIELAVEEVFTNIASYAYGSKGGIVRVVCSMENMGDKLRICFMDTGIPHNPLDHDDPDTTLMADLRPIGGLGIFLIKEFMDNIFYEYREGSNILTIEKHHRA